MDTVHLASFVLLVLVFFYWSYSDLHAYPDEAVLGAVLKLTPLITLLRAVRLTPAQDAVHAHQLTWFTNGLLASMVGDVLMHWRHTFLLPAMGAFGLAHLCYIKAFRLKPRGYEAASFCFTSGLVTFMFLLPGIRGRVLQVAVLLYSTVVMATWWRAIVQWQQAPTLVNLLGAGGGLLFAASDFLIGLDTWKFPGRVPFASCSIMVTYYMAQLLLAVPVVNYGWTLMRPDDGHEKKKG